ncbi:hypothetical protein SEMRO_1574_G283500.1 [Seminavis robusta]|uniref:Uncharacterized protein n=1 Tax=Seminavis robusta TaxID=568900 RepID=A0A9N8HTZ4_9STRA|nr:hypothetical protein SEMRO_1574_G283500.1 [Seminavis robusta]|eukprot:Sro1574_g283500.1 n/a (108) ;mRNA; r:2935-3317
MSRKDDRAYATDDEETKRPPVMNSTEGYFIPTPKFVSNQRRDSTSKETGERQKRKFSEAFGNDKGGFFSDVVWNSMTSTKKQQVQVQEDSGCYNQEDPTEAIAEGRV